MINFAPEGKNISTSINKKKEELRNFSVLKYNKINIEIY